MIRLNQSVQNLKPSSTLAINQSVKQLRNEGEVIYHFGFGQSPFPIHESITSALKKHVDNNNYLPTIGLDKLRKEISVFLDCNQEVQYNSEYVFIGPGSKELLYQTILILEGVFLIPKGSWVSYVPQIKSKNGDYKILETSFENNFKLSANVLEKYCEENSNIQKTLILNSPNNPTGAVYKNEELEALANVCRKHSVIIISDEIYSQVNFKDNFSPSIAKFYPEKTIVFGGLSKVFSAGGYRLGFMALPEDLHQLKTMYSSLFSETFSAVSSPIQYAAITAYQYKVALKDYVEKCSKILQLVSQFVHNNLKSIGIDCTIPEGAFYMMIGFNKFKEQLKNIGIFTSNQLSEHLLNDYKIALLPSTDFYFSKGELFFRLAYVDFNGKKAIIGYENYKDKPEDFINKYCPSIYQGTHQIIKFINDLG